jgi:hypothetical protein
MDANARHFLNRALQRGDMVLFTGAGFSHEARSRTGDQLPLGRQLAKALWPLAFPNNEFDQTSSLGEIYDVAVRVARLRTRDLLNELLRVDPKNIPAFYHQYLRVGWHRIYSLNLDDLLEVCSREVPPLNGLQSVSFTHDASFASNELLEVHINGRISDFPDVTFSPPQYGERTARPDPVYSTMVNDLVGRPVVYIGTELNESPLWHHIALRGDKGPGRELRPKSFLVSPTLPIARAAMLERFNVIHIPMDAEAFADEILAPIVINKSLPVKQRVSQYGSWDDVANVRGETAEDPAEFLLGREPVWSDCISGYAISRNFEDDVYKAFETAVDRVVLVSGTAGSGKSTTLKKAALHLQASGHRTLWLRQEANETIARISSHAVSFGPDYCFIDDGERFGERLRDLIERLARLDSCPVIVVGLPSTRVDVLLPTGALEHLSLKVTPIPSLDDSDIDKLLDALNRANRLGRLAAKSPDERIKAFREGAQRQILVAMIEATSGKRFEDKIDDECREVATGAALVYATIALATEHHYEVSQDEVVGATGEAHAAIESIDQLVRAQLVFRSPDRRVRTRHPLIAERVVNYFRGSGQLGAAIAGLAFVLSTKVYVGMPKNGARRVLTILVNHDYLRREIPSQFEIRSLYQELESTLRDDPHYWLQRGTYELEAGDLIQADVFLAQARGLRPGDYMIDTEWAYLLLKRAIASPRDSLSYGHAEEAIDLLLDIAEKSGHRTVNTYAVLAQSGSQWYEVCELSPSEKKDGMLILKATIEEGCHKHSSNRRLRAACQDFEKRYLMLATKH